MNVHNIPTAAAPAGTKQRLGPIVFAVDAAYAVPLATALRSVAENNQSVWPLDIHVIHEGIGEETKRLILESLPANSAIIQWHPIATLSFASGFSTRPGVSKMTFARILLPQFLPQTCDRALYLDGDILVLTSLEQLWNTDLGEAVIGAVPDYWLDNPAGNGPGARGGALVKRYFNAGILLIDLAKWRNERISERSLDYLDRFPTTEYSDQDALNVACDGKWKILDRAWNFQFEPRQAIAGIALEQKAAIVHFVTNVKPWKSGSLSPNVAFYDAFRSRTRFALTPWGRVRSGLRRAGSRLLARSALLRAAWSYTKSAVRARASASGTMRKKT
ncbi:UNVERIFIED_ORG: lipopolysaccharide biosynthesis glycosyltransferase [Rhizobium esperanzae]|uniref:Glycosyltransferase family 8 protein n=1 Tax=Rhizobium phaseoli TaxID=396 RepID=A0A7X6EVA9_9HYPH|nr:MULTISPECIES: glycosyltransferase family 8 protein [Rhizobium]MDH6646304.1 lipopolysaccharide biosynthesis glycosyltransferase [Rhizobium esperanzae]ANL44411.1 glycosyltransferase family 8 protein [Rhizobium phaseoli]ANL63375.1 glycosyltransferase family 8 protein [Rhizobium phaseoli]MDE8757987.1 glycosyltransferase family 8 protein [Rhizobium sp. CBK13]NKF09349.1 glycosyltransferase family 8 protein [Rhizobium phaseoli]